MRGSDIISDKRLPASSISSNVSFLPDANSAEYLPPVLISSTNYLIKTSWVLLSTSKPYLREASDTTLPKRP